uniref:Uncharacterized protein n=1 Tax=Cacopsylla melanoneura TaxID=428564 RepID=A0A8D8WN31_9HEMI
MRLFRACPILLFTFLPILLGSVKVASKLGFDFNLVISTRLIDFLKNRSRDQLIAKLTVYYPTDEHFFFLWWLPGYVHVPSTFCFEYFLGGSIFHFHFSFSSIKRPDCRLKFSSVIKLPFSRFLYFLFTLIHSSPLSQTYTHTLYFLCLSTFITPLHTHTHTPPPFQVSVRT